MDFKQIKAWIENQIQTMRYGEISIKFILHDGHIKRTERTVTIKEQNIEVEHLTDSKKRVKKCQF